MRNTIAMMRAKPAISVGAKTVPKKIALVIVADTGSTVPMRLARIEPMSFTPCIYKKYARNDPTKTSTAKAPQPIAPNTGACSHGRMMTEDANPDTSMPMPVTIEEPYRARSPVGMMDMQAAPTAAIRPMASPSGGITSVEGLPAVASR